jgi:hypothetical protein
VSRQSQPNRLLGNAPSETRTAHKSTCHLSYEVVEMIIAHIARDLDTLKACSLTCRPWYIAAVPHLHHTPTLTDRGGLKPLSQLNQLGLMPLIKEIRVEQKRIWFVAQAFSRRDLRYFSAFENVHTLKFKYSDISLFIPGVECYFGRFSPTLRSVSVFNPIYTPRQLSHFLSLFQT